MVVLVLMLGCQAVTGPLRVETPVGPTVGWPTVVNALATRAAPATGGAPVATATVGRSTATVTLAPPPATPEAPTGWVVRYHPDGGLYVGDQVSLEVIAPQALAGETSVTVGVDESETKLGPQKFGLYGIAGRTQATLWWVWDTAGLAAGEHRLTFAIQPGGPTWTETVRLLPASAMPAGWRTGQWAEARSVCCVLHYITGTAAERDLAQLLALADAQAEDASRRLQIDFTQPITVTVMARVLGHGGFASDEINISYLDQNYAGSSFALVLHHEMIHILDFRLGGKYRPTFFVEGLAVYLSDGHFKIEPLLPRAAALRSLESGGLGWYIPLQTLMDNFYPQQHEIGYLEGAAVIEYMVQTWGWTRFNNFYRQIEPPAPGKTPSQAVDAALQASLGLSLAQLEADFLAALGRERLTPALLGDVRLTVAYYDAVRLYQQQLDPSAYFMTAWLADGKEMRRRGLTADFLRHPQAPLNIEIESLLLSANALYLVGDYEAAEATLEQVKSRLK
jgi:hypothetical protein